MTFTNEELRLIAADETYPLKAYKAQALAAEVLRLREVERRHDALYVHFADVHRALGSHDELLRTAAGSVRQLVEDLAFARKEQHQAVAAAQIIAQHNDRLKAALKRELDGCFCDDRDGNCNPPAAPECERCLRIRKALE